jgi:hypothetical protein
MMITIFFLCQWEFTTPRSGLQMPAAVCFIRLTRDSVQALALMTQGEQKAGLAVGTVASLILLILDIKRVFDVGGCHDIHV